MKALISAVGQRTEHWIDLFRALATQEDLAVTVVVCDVSPLTVAGLERCARETPMRFVVLPHVCSESRTGHMASVMIRPAALRQLAIDEPDVIHVIGEASYLSTRQVVRIRDRRWPRCPVTVYAAQNVVIRFPPPFRQLEQRTYRQMQLALPITPAALGVLRTKGYRGEATIVPLGVDTALFQPRDERPSGSPFTVGFVGRLEEHKGIRELLAATEALDCNVVVVGSGSLADIVRAAAHRRPGRVDVRDWVDHERLPEILATMDVLALPSKEVVQRNVVRWIGIPLREQFGRVLVEAMACGVPVVGSDVGEIAHVIGDAGLICAAGDADSLATQLARIRDDRALATVLAQRGVARATDNFSWRTIATQLRDQWQRAIAGPVLATSTRHRRM